MFVSHTHHVGVGMMGKGTGIVVGTKTCIRTCTHGTLTCLPIPVYITNLEGCQRGDTQSEGVQIGIEDSNLGNVHDDRAVGTL